MKTCKNCGAAVEEDAAFCPNCGAAMTGGNAGETEHSSVPQETLNPAENAVKQENGAEGIGTSDGSAEQKPDQTERNAAPSAGPGYASTAAGVDQSPAPGAADTAAEQKKKKRNRRILIAAVAAAAVVVIAVVLFAGKGTKSASDQTIVYEGIEFHVPEKWKLSEDASSDDGLIFYTGKEKSGEMLCMAAIPDAGYLLNLFGADYLMNYLVQMSGGSAVDARSVKAAGYDAYVFGVNGASTSPSGESVKGGYRMAYIINTDNSELLVLYAVGLSASADDTETLADLDYILGHATATTAANAYGKAA